MDAFRAASSQSTSCPSLQALHAERALHVKLAADLGEAQAKLDTLARQLAARAPTPHAAAQEADALRKQLAAANFLQLQAVCAAQEAGDLRAQLSTAKQQLANECAAREAAAAEAAALRGQLQQSQRQLGAAVHWRAAAEREGTHLARESGRLRAQCDAAMAAAQGMRQHCAELTEQLAEAGQGQDATWCLHMEAQTELTSLRGQLAAAQAQCAQLQALLHTSQRALQELPAPTHDCMETVCPAACFVLSAHPSMALAHSRIPYASAFLKPCTSASFF